MIARPLLFSSPVKRSSVILLRTYADLTVDWKRPVKVEWYDPKKTGDGVSKLEVDMSKTTLELENNKELETASEEVKKLFSFHFLGRKHAMKRAVQEMVNEVRNHQYDHLSLEVNIAAKTGTIRNLLELMHNSTITKKAKLYLKELIERRNKKLKELRKFDYKKFEWLLEKLDLYYKPLPEILDKVERKKSIRKLTERYCDDYKENKLNEYREFLESQKVDFYKESIIALEWIQKEEKECGLEPSVTGEDIENAKKKLDDYLRSIEKIEKKKTSTNILLNV